MKSYKRVQNRTTPTARRWYVSQALCVALLAATSAGAQTEYPNKAVRLIVPSAPGGSSDIVGRIVAQRLSHLWGQPVVVDNRGAVNGVVGAELGQNAAPDGYTLTIGNSGTHSMNYGLYKTLPYDPVKGFSAIAKMVSSPTVLLANSTLPITSARELITLAKSRPVYIAAPGATAGFASRMLNAMAGTNITIVPYKGSAPADLSVLQNETQLSFTSVGAAKVHVQTGRAKIIAVTSMARDPALPDVPTLDESGVKGFELEYWVGLFAPAGTSMAIIQKLNADIEQVLATPEVRKRLFDAGFNVKFLPSTHFPEYVRTMAERNAKQMRELGIPAE